MEVERKLFYCKAVSGKVDRKTETVNLQFLCYTGVI